MSKKSFSFGLGGWLQLYSFGVAKYIRERGLHQDAVFTGCSTGVTSSLITIYILFLFAGAIVATLSAFDGDFDLALEYCKTYGIPRMYSHFFGPFKMHDYVQDCLEYTCDLRKCDSAFLGGLRVLVTKIPSFAQSAFQTPFASPDDLKQCILASCATFPFAGPVFNGKSWMVDGSYAISNVDNDAGTITVSPFYFSSALIKPSRYVPLWWSLFPPADSETIDWLFRCGDG